MEMNENFSEQAKTDFRLVDAAKSGDQAAYGQIMVRYRETIYFMILKMVKNEVEAEDLAIEAFEKAFNKLAQYTPQYAFSTWLFRIATNHCIDFIRKKKLKTTSIDEALNQDSEGGYHIQVPSKTKDPEETFIEQQKIELMRELVSGLTEPYQSLVELRYFKELSYEEIAEKKSIPLGTVKAQLFRARAIMADLIRKSKKSI